MAFILCCWRLACCRSRLLVWCGLWRPYPQSVAVVRSVRVVPWLRPPARVRWVPVMRNACDSQSRWLGVELEHEQHPRPGAESGTSPRSSLDRAGAVREGFSGHRPHARVVGNRLRNALSVEPRLAPDNYLDSQERWRLRRCRNARGSLPRLHGTSEIAGENA